MKLHPRMTKSRALAALVILSIITSLWGAGLAGRLRSVVAHVVAPLGHGPMYLATAVKKRTDSPAAEALTAEEHRRLREEMLALRGQREWLLQLVVKYKTQLQNQEAFCKRFSPTEDIPCELIPAQVAAADSLPYGDTRLVPVGGSQGAEPGSRVTTRELLTDRAKALPPNLSVVTRASLVGRLTETGRFAARVQLAIDPGFRMEAIVRRDVDPGSPREVEVRRPGGGTTNEVLTTANNHPVEVTVEGTGNALKVEFVKRGHGIREGDHVFTRSDSRLLPVSVYIGRVTRVKDVAKQPSYVSLWVQPYLDFGSLRDVYVVVPRAERLEGGR